MVGWEDGLNITRFSIEIRNEIYPFCLPSALAGGFGQSRPGGSRPHSVRNLEAGVGVKYLKSSDISALLSDIAPETIVKADLEVTAKEKHIVAMTRRARPGVREH